MCFTLLKLLIYSQYSDCVHLFYCYKSFCVLVNLLFVFGLGTRFLRWSGEGLVRDPGFWLAEMVLWFLNLWIPSFLLWTLDLCDLFIMAFFHLPL